jgi:hypothetical protein
MTVVLDGLARARQHFSTAHGSLDRPPQPCRRVMLPSVAAMLTQQAPPRNRGLARIVIVVIFVITVKGRTVHRNRTSVQIGQELGLAAATVQKYAREHRIPFDLTPGGHRRFDLEEVRQALYLTSPNLRAVALTPDGGLGAGAPVTYSPAAAAERDTRALVAIAPDDGATPATALQDLFSHARRVLVSTSR